MSTNLVEKVASVVSSLPTDKQQEILNFAEFVAQRTSETEVETKQPRQSLLGLWSDLGIEITSEDIDEARREMWGNFPREDVL